MQFPYDQVQPGQAAPCSEERPFHIDRKGQWYYRGTAITRPALVELFARVLQRETDGDYWLVTPVERVGVSVADSPLTIVELRATGEGTEQRLELRSNLGDRVMLGPDHPLELRPDDHGTAVPYVHIRAGLDARLLRPVYYDLVEHARECRVDGRVVIGVWSDGRFFALDDTGAPGDAGAGDRSG